MAVSFNEFKNELRNEFQAGQDTNRKLNGISEAYEGTGRNLNGITNAYMGAHSSDTPYNIRRNSELWLHTQFSADGGKTWDNFGVVGIPMGTLEEPMVTSQETRERYQSKVPSFNRTDMMTKKVAKRVKEGLQNGTIFTGDCFTLFEGDWGSVYKIRVVVKVQVPGYERTSQYSVNAQIEEELDKLF